MFNMSPCISVSGFIVLLLVARIIAKDTEGMLGVLFCSMCCIWRTFKVIQGREGEQDIEMVKREKRKFFCKFLNRLTPKDLKVARKLKRKLQRLFLR